MLETGEPCNVLAQQLQAVESAIANAKTTLIEDHLDHCLEHILGPLESEKRREVDEIKKMAKYL